MSDQRENGTYEAKSLVDSLASGRITAGEAETIKSFFASKPAAQWPTNDMQKRMQNSGG